MLENNTPQTDTTLTDPVETLLKQETISAADLAALSEDDWTRAMATLNQQQASLSDDEYEAFALKTEGISDLLPRRPRWDQNHALIVKAYTDILRETGLTPSTTDLVNRTNLSRPTIRKHVGQFNQHPGYAEHFQQIAMLGTTLLARLFNLAMKDNVQAAKLFFKVLHNPYAAGLGIGTYPMKKPFELQTLQKLLKQA
jgi:hypothetical protein